MPALAAAGSALVAFAIAWILFGGPCKRKHCDEPVYTPSEAGGPRNPVDEQSMKPTQTTEPHTAVIQRAAAGSEGLSAPWPSVMVGTLYPPPPPYVE